MIETYSLLGITRVGSKGMISARNYKAPHFVDCWIKNKQMPFIVRQN